MQLHPTSMVDNCSLKTGESFKKNAVMIWSHTGIRYCVSIKPKSTSSFPPKSKMKSTPAVG